MTLSRERASVKKTVQTFKRKYFTHYCYSTAFIWSTIANKMYPTVAMAWSAKLILLGLGANIAMRIANACTSDDDWFEQQKMNIQCKNHAYLFQSCMRLFPQ